MPAAIAEPPKPSAPPPQTNPTPPPGAAPSPAPPPPPKPPETSSAFNIPQDDPFFEADREIMEKFQKVEGVKPEPKEPKVEPKPEVAQVKAPEKPAIKVPDKPGPLRTEIERLSTTLKKRDEDYASMESKLKEMEAKGQDTTKLVERMGNLETELKKRESVIRRLRKEESPEFIQQYRQPFTEAAEDARSVFNQLQVEIKNEVGEVVSTRAANWDSDFSTLFAMDRANANREAKKMFGEDRETVMHYYDDLHQRQRTMQRALKAEQENAEKSEKEEESLRLQREEEMRGILDRVTKEVQERTPDYQDPVDDPELADIRKKGYELFDAVPKTFQQHVVKQAHVRHRVAAYGPLQLKNARLTKQLAEAKAELEKLSDTPPIGDTRRKGGDSTSPKPEEDWEQAAIKAVKSAA